MSILALMLGGLLVGASQAATCQPPPYCQYFYSMPGASDGWEYYSSNSYGRIAVVNGRLRMDSRYNGNYVLNEAILHLCLSGWCDVQLTFWQADHSDEETSLPATFTGHRNGDGVAISDDGIQWYTVVNANELAVSSSGQNFTVDLDAEVERIRRDYDAGFGYTNDFHVKFQQYDNYTYSTDGREWDNVCVDGMPCSDLEIAPPNDFVCFGGEEGPFTPASKVYTLTNTGANSLDWSALSTCSWVEVDLSGGTLPAYGDANVTISLNSEVNSFEPNTYECDVVFTDLKTDSEQAVGVLLEVLVVPGQIGIYDTIGDVCDREMDFNEVVVGLSITEHITITNVDTNPRHELIIESISIIDPNGPELTAGSAGYIEDFNDGDSQDWEEHFNGVWDVVYPYGDGDGEYHPASIYDYRMMQSMYRGQKWQDLSFQATIRRTYSGYDAGVIVRASEDFSYPASTGSAYVISEDGNRNYWVRKYVSGSWSYLQSSTYSSYLNSGSEGNVIKVKLTGPDIEVYFNGNLAWSGTDSSVADSGYVGLFAYQRRAYYHYYFDDVLVQPSGFSLGNLPSLPLVLDAGESFEFDVNFAPVSLGDYESRVLISSDDIGEPNAEVLLVGTGVPEYLDIAPVNDVEFYGHPGGPFVPTYIEYVLTNTGPYSIDWAAEPSVMWLDIFPADGTLAPGETITVEVVPNELACGLEEGDYCGEIIYTDLTTTLEQTRGVCLNAYTEPKIWANPYSYSVVIPQGSSQAQRLTIGNTGGADLHYSVQAGSFGSPWVELVPESGVVGAGDTNDVEVVFHASCDGGMYQGWITIDSNDPYMPQILIPVTIIVETIDYFTELFEPNYLDPNDPASNDMSYRTLAFIPDGSNNYYSICLAEATDFPVDPAGGNVVSLGDDDYEAVGLLNSSVSFYGTEYDTFYIGSNGYISFTTGDISHSESLSSHFNFPRISAMYDDLDPSAGGTISWKEVEGGIVVTFEDVPEYSLPTGNSFQVEMRFNGKIRITFLDIAARDGLVGLSEGNGEPVCFIGSNLSEGGPCLIYGDLSGDMEVDFIDYSIFANNWCNEYEMSSTVRDEFNTVSYSNNDGSEDWAGDWQEWGEIDGPTSGFLQVCSEGRLQIGPTNRRFDVAPVRSVSREADLSGCVLAKLSYDYETVVKRGIGYLSAEISPDGFHWITLANYGYGTGSGTASFDITPYISGDTQIRFRGSTNIGVCLYVDNVEIEYGGPMIQWFPWSNGCDLNHDWKVDLADLQILCERWLK